MAHPETEGRNPIEIARLLFLHPETNGCDLRAAARHFEMSYATATKRVRLLLLPPEAQRMVVTGHIGLDAAENLTMLLQSPDLFDSIMDDLRRGRKSAKAIHRCAREHLARYTSSDYIQRSNTNRKKNIYYVTG